jgi:murein L,D-transpeptidase YcbB/YkuD
MRFLTGVDHNLKAKLPLRQAALVAATSVIFLSYPAQAENAPFKTLKVDAFPALVQQLTPRRAGLAESELFSSRDMPAVVTSTSVQEDAQPSEQIDFAEALLPEGRRELLAALDVWLKAPLTGPDAADRRRQRAAIAGIYASRGYAPFWRETSPEGASWLPAAAAAAQRLRSASEDGLDLRTYLIPSVDQGAPGIEDELALSDAVVAYAAQAAGSRVDPSRISHLIGARPQLPAPTAVLTSVATAGDQAGDVLQSYNPHHYGYTLLRTKLAELRSERAMDGRSSTQLALAGSVRDDTSPAAKVRRKSAKRSRQPNAHLEAEVIANMERWRWLPRDLGENRIEVNIPDFEAAVIRGGEVTHRARIIVGKEQTPTPIFSNAMQFIIVNPYWNVPPSILNKEMLPQNGGDVSALQQRGFQVSYRHGKLSVRQPPGERNALGRIKFMFPNDFSVYMHDTPSRNLFSASHRAFSHGCMRVDQPFALAEAVLGPGSGWSEQRVRRLIGGSERYINLAKPLPIHIEYFTAYVDEDGQLQLRGDLYGYSARVRNALRLGG